MTTRDWLQAALERNAVNEPTVEATTDGETPYVLVVAQVETAEQVDQLVTGIDVMIKDYDGGNYLQGPLSGDPALELMVIGIADSALAAIAQTPLAGIGF